MDRQQFFILCLFGVVAMVAYGCSVLLVRDRRTELTRRLFGGAPGAGRAATKGPTLLNRMGEAMARPFTPQTPERVSALRQRLSRAGLYSSAAMRLFIAARVTCLLCGAALGFLAGALIDKALLGVSMGGLAGYVLPAMWLRRRTRTHQGDLDRGLSDALDLMVVCVEAGLTTDVAMQRVGREIALPHPALAREFTITHSQTQMGVPRAEAMRNLAQRTGSPSIQSLAAMLIQTDRFGTSVANTLRVHAESLRLKRQYAAEEAAAKTSVKLIFPVALLIFPNVLMVLVGPAIIQMVLSGFLKR